MDSTQVTIIDNSPRPIPSIRAGAIPYGYFYSDHFGSDDGRHLYGRCYIAQKGFCKFFRVDYPMRTFTVETDDFIRNYEPVASISMEVTLG